MRVVEMASDWTRFAGRLLAGLGWEVTLVADPAREQAPDPDSLAFAHWHAGKSLAWLDLASPAGASELRTLLRDADALLDDGAIARAGLSVSAVAAEFPALVHVVVSPFGLDGPWHSWQATDLIVAAAGGMLAQVGRPDSPPLLPPESQAEHLAGVNAALGVLLGIQARPGVGRGQLVDISAQECVAASLEAGALAYIHTDRVPPRPGDTHPLVPHRLFRAADGHLAGGLGGSPRMWDALVGWLCEEGAQDDLDDPRYADPAERMRAKEHILAVLARFIETRPKEALADEAQGRRLPWAAVARPDEVAANPHLTARSFFTDVPWRGARHRDVGAPFRLARTAEPARTAIPESPAAGRLPRRAPRCLDGIRVLDLTWVLAGPYATRILADHGAEVIKIESRRRPDPTRFAPYMHLSRDEASHPDSSDPDTTDPDTTDPDTSGYFNNINRNKRSVTLNLRSPDGLALVKRLTATCDVVIENFAAGVLERLGLGYRQLRELRPDVVYVSMSGMGHTGPWRDRVCYADTVAAASGLTALTGGGRDDVVGVIYGHGDIVAGHHGALAVLAALDERRRTGAGQHIDLSQLEAMTAHMGTSVLEWTARGVLAEPRGDRDPARAPHGVYRCLGPDRWCAIAVRDDRDWRALASVLGHPELGVDPRFATSRARLENIALVDELVSDWTAALPPMWVADRLQRAGVPAAPVQDGRDLVEADPQLRERGFYVRVRHPRVGAFLHEGVPIRLSATPGAVRTAAPPLGADTEDVLRGIGVSASRQERLRRDGVLS